MYAVGRLGSYISRGVYTVSAPFHPFGGAVDIVVVEQQDESFKSSPWYVRFGKFQGVLKAKEKVVHINVNGVDANFHMHLDHTGEAYFLHEVDAEGDLILSHASSYEEMDELGRRQMKANSRNYGVDPSDLEVSNGKVFNRTGSRRSRILGLAIGRNSVKENKFQDEENSADIVRAESLERAEIAANLLEMNWSTNLASVRKEKNNSPDTLDGVESKSGAFKRQSTIYYETFDASKLELDDFGEQPDETLFVHGILGEGSRCDFVSDEKIHESEITSSKTNRVLTETLSEPLLVELIDDSTQEFDSISQVQNERSKEDENEMLQPFVEPSCDQEVSSDLLQTEAIKKTSSIELEEEQFIFSDLDDIEDGDGKCTDVIYPDHMDIEKYTSFTSEGVNSVNNSSHSGFVSPDKFVQENQPNDGEEVREEAKVISNEISIPIRSKFAGQEQVGGMAESLPIMWSHFDESDEHFFRRPLGHSLDSNPKSSKWKLLRENLSSCIKADAENVHRLSDSQPTIDDATNLGKLKNVDSSPAVGIPSEIVETSSRSWGIWPFPFKRSSSMKETHPSLKITRSLDADISLEGTIGMDGEREVPKPKVYKKKIRAISPTTEQLASLNLKDGRNIVKFTFSTAMLGKQQVDARIYLWRWDTRVVITDVDGTITKSDVLGQFMPLVGKDWSQTGVAHLFSAIKENGYQLLFLSARAISQAGLTRQFLFNLKQDGKALPDGPVVISPDGLFPSLFREVIRRAPHEFKIACLEDIKACFPSDRNPFYAGFGNRDTDEFSYLKVGIPKGKIFIINPKGEVVVNRCNNKSYTSLHALVNGMFPPTSSEQEDFNSWNFWKLPPPVIDI